MFLVSFEYYRMNFVVWRFLVVFRGKRVLVGRGRVRCIGIGSDDFRVIIMVVIIVYTFLNIFFRLRVFNVSGDLCFFKYYSVDEINKKFSEVVSRGSVLFINF